MNDKVLVKLKQDFSKNDIDQAIEILNGLTLDHVMAASTTNLINAQLSILLLAKGDLDNLKDYTSKAKVDFRDVIFWARSL